MSLARGLDYYTGVIYEAVLTDTHQVGSIGGGGEKINQSNQSKEESENNLRFFFFHDTVSLGRYDNLIGMFGTQRIPAVGFSVGIERIFNILEEKLLKKAKVRVNDTDVYVASIDKGQLKERMKICAELWSAGINVEKRTGGLQIPNFFFFFF